MTALSTKMWSILRGSSRNPGGEECTYGIECSRTGGGAGSGRRFSGSRRQDLSYHSDVLGGAPGSACGRTRCAASAAADGRPRRGAGQAAAGSGAVEEGARGDPRARRENAAADRVDCGGQLEAAGCGCRDVSGYVSTENGSYGYGDQGSDGERRAELQRAGGDF